MKRLLRACAAALLFWAPAAPAQWLELSWVDPALRWRTLETAHFSVHFADRHRSQARIVAGVAESIYPRITGLLQWRPQSRTDLVLLDSADFANGFASPLPFSYSGIFLSPPDEGELLQNREWLELVLAHELFHIVHLDKASGAPLALRRLFGRVPPAGLNRVSMNLFFDAGAAWDRGTRPDYHRGVGVELMSELRLGYLFGLHARAGVAKGIDAPGRTTAYLRLGRSF